MTDGTMTLAEAGALAAVLSAAERRAPVARLITDVRFVMHADAQYIGGKDPDQRDFQAEGSADVRDLFLVVRHAPHPLIDIRKLGTWPVRALITEYLAGTFMTDVTRDEPASASR